MIKLSCLACYLEKSDEIRTNLNKDMNLISPLPHILASENQIRIQSSVVHNAHYGEAAHLLSSAAEYHHNSKKRKDSKGFLSLFFSFSFSFAEIERLRSSLRFCKQQYQKSLVHFLSSLCVFLFQYCADFIFYLYDNENFLVLWFSRKIQTNDYCTTI